MKDITETWAGCPAWIRTVVERHVESGESPLTWFEPDLNHRLQYSAGLVVLTDRRILQFDWDAATLRNGSPDFDPKSFKFYV